MSSEAFGQDLRASHLRRAAQSAGEAFAYSVDEAEAARIVGTPWRISSRAIWLGVGAAAALGLYASF